MSKIICLALGAVVFGASFLAEAQQPKKLPRIGLLFTIESSPPSPNVEAFRQGVRRHDNLGTWIRKGGANEGGNFCS